MNAWPLIFSLVLHVTTKGFLVTIKTLDFGCHNLFCHRALLMHVCTFPWKWKHELVWNNFVSVRFFLNGTFSTSISKLMYYFYYALVIWCFVRRNMIVAANRIMFTVRTKRKPRVSSYCSKEQNSFFCKTFITFFG